MFPLKAPYLFLDLIHNIQLYLDFASFSEMSVLPPPTKKLAFAGSKPCTTRDIYATLDNQIP